MAKTTNTKDTKDIKTTGLSTGVMDRKSSEAQGRFVRGYQKGCDTATRTITGVASTINLDLEGEVILPSAFAARLPMFVESHAPFLSAHTHRTDDGKPSQIGWVTDVRITAVDVQCSFRFGKTAAAEEWWLLASDPNGKGIAFSIGFMPIKWVQGTPGELVAAYPELRTVFASAGLADTQRIRVYTEIELFEISAVPVPCNRQSLQTLAAKFFNGSQDKEDAEGEPLVDALASALLENLDKQIAEVMTDVKASLDDLREDIAELSESLEFREESLADNINESDDSGHARAEDAGLGDDDDDDEPGEHEERSVVGEGEKARQAYLASL